MQCVCKTIRFNFEPTLSSNKICLYGRRFKKKKKRARDRRRGTGDWVNSYSSGWQKPSVWCHPVSLFSIMCRGWKQTAATLCWIKSGENAANQRVALNSSREKMALGAHVALRLSEVAGVFFFFFWRYDELLNMLEQFWSSVDLDRVSLFLERANAEKPARLEKSYSCSLILASSWRSRWFIYGCDNSYV